MNDTNAVISQGHYFEFKRGEYVQKEGQPTAFYQAGGISYVGSLTEEQRIELDALISDYIKRIRS